MSTYIFQIFVTVKNHQTSCSCALSCNGTVMTLGGDNSFSVNWNDVLIISSYGYYNGTSLTGFVLPNTLITQPTPPSGLFDIPPAMVGGISSLFCGIFSAQLGDYMSFPISGFVGDPDAGGNKIPWTVSDPKISVVAPN